MSSSGFNLKDLIEDESWENVVSLDPDLVTRLIGFENSQRLANALVSDYNTPEFSREYAVRLLYSLKENYSEWKNSWKNEAMLANICEWAMKYHESHYAGERGRRLVSPMPPALALLLGTVCDEGPFPLTSSEEKCQLLEYSLKDKPYMNALLGLKFLYARIPGKEARLGEILQLLEKFGNSAVEDAPITPICVGEPIVFESPPSKYFIPVKIISREELFDYCRTHNWSQLVLVDPRFIVKNLSFSDSLRLAYRLANASKECQKYSVRLLYSLRIQFLGKWVDTWRHDVFLGYCCEAAGKYDEQFGAYFEASLIARLAHDNRPFTDVSAVPAGLMIALARCAFLPDPSITFEQATIWLEDVLKLEMYVDALELLLRIYKTTNQIDRAVDLTRILENIQPTGQYSRLPLPLCLGENFDEIS